MSTGPSLYRRHRPRTFADVVGQEQIVRTLSNAITRGKVHHAYLFVGTRGTGKTSTAKILAACLNCEQGPTIEPCGVCESCVSIANASSLDVIEMDAASNNSVDDIRDLREKVAYSPVSGRHKIYILDEAHMLSSQAWNAFLKTLEEPPPRTIFVLATTEAQKVLPTVVDRCHRFDFGRPTVEQVAQVLRRVAASEQIDIESGAMALIARHATGSFRDALGTLEQLVTYAGEDQIKAGDVLAVLGVADAEQLFEAVDAVLARDPAQALRVAARLTDSGRDPGQILRDLEVHGRELLAVQVLDEVPEQLRITPERDARLLAQAQALAGADVVRLLDLVAAALEATTNGAQARIQLELLLIKAASPEVDPATTALLARIERLENALLAGVTSPGEPTKRGPQQSDSAPRPEPVISRTAPATQAARSAPSEAQAALASPPQADPQADPHPAEHEANGVAEVGADPELGTLVASWPAVIELLGQENQLLASSLAAARPVSLTDRGLTLAFPTGREFYKRKAEQDENRRATAEALRSVVGAMLTLRYEMRDETEPVAQDSAGLSHEELVRRLVAEFDAEEVLDDPDQEEAT
ncbi:MAG: DNA polymerase III subunit gamma/tau [Actinomycetota bacterium]|nr:DNA polymerase III subunit gamma/tau [Actinomycetota bacterium]